MNKMNIGVVVGSLAALAGISYARSKMSRSLAESDGTVADRIENDIVRRSNVAFRSLAYGKDTREDFLDSMLGYALKTGLSVPYDAPPSPYNGMRLSAVYDALATDDDLSEFGERQKRELDAMHKLITKSIDARNRDVRRRR